MPGCSDETNVFGVIVVDLFLPRGHVVLGQYFDFAQLLTSHFKCCISRIDS